MLLMLIFDARARAQAVLSDEAQDRKNRKRTAYHRSIDPTCSIDRSSCRSCHIDPSRTALLTQKHPRWKSLDKLVNAVVCMWPRRDSSIPLPRYAGAAWDECLAFLAFPVLAGMTNANPVPNPVVVGFPGAPFVLSCLGYLHRRAWTRHRLPSKASRRA